MNPTITRDARAHAVDVIDVSRSDGPERTFVQMMISWVGAAGLALLAPLLLLAVGVPVVFAIRTLLAFVQSLLAAIL